MPEAFFYPLDQIRPDQLLNQYSDWIYFTLLLIFFISIAGLTLRKHFNRPYVKPLIISVGIFLTVAVFMFRNRLVLIIEGWGVVGLIILVVILASIPYNLCTGYGMQPRKAFYLTYALLYIVAWVSFPSLFYFLSNKNLGLINLAFLIMFFFAVFKILPFGKSKTDYKQLVKSKNPFAAAIKQNIDEKRKEGKLIQSKMGKAVKFEVHTTKDIAEALAQIQSVVEKNPNNFSEEDRKKLVELLEAISNKEHLFLHGLEDLKKSFQKVTVMNEKQMGDLKGRLKLANDEEKKLLKYEIQLEESKIELFRDIEFIDHSLPGFIDAFNKFIRFSVDKLKNPEQHYAAKDGLLKARMKLREIIDLLQRIQKIKKRLFELTKIQNKLLQRERTNA